jgi:hypothetical protein
VASSCRHPRDSADRPRQHGVLRRPIVSSAPIEVLTASPRRLTSSSSKYLPIVEQFAAGFDSLPETVEALAEARMVIGTGRLVRAFAALRGEAWGRVGW